MSATPEQIVERLEKPANWLRQDRGEHWKSVTNIYDRAPFEAAALIRSLTATSSAATARIARLEEAATHLCAAIDNLWNHPDLRHVRADVPESIKLNISRGQLLVRAALGSDAA